MLINNANSTFPYQGILGLSPNVDDGDYLTLGSPIPLHLKKTGKIQNAMVALDMYQDTTIQSTIMFGGYDESKYRNKTDKSLQWFNVPVNTNRFAWTREVKNVFYNGVSYDDGYVNTGTFDSFYGGLHLPQAEWKKTFSQIQANLTAAGLNYLQCDNTLMQCSFNGRCSDNQKDWHNFDFNFEGDRSYIVTPQNYMLDYTDKSGRNLCNIAIYGNQHNPTEYILGDVFMQNMYVILDYENSKFAVNGNYRIVEPRFDKPERPEQDSSSISVWAIIGIVAGVLVLVGVIGFCIVRAKNKRLQSNLAKYETL
jgi:Eukaryotic aspartyl protease